MYIKSKPMMLYPVTISGSISKAVDRPFTSLLLFCRSAFRPRDVVASSYYEHVLVDFFTHLIYGETYLNHRIAFELR
jgi:hypothetical protein